MNNAKRKMMNASSIHPSALFPDSKAELLEALHDPWEVDPVRKVAIAAGQKTPRYFKLSNNGRQRDPLSSLQTMLRNTRYHCFCGYVCVSL